ncbi:hypothetical protein ACXR8F_10935 [Terrabacter sp. AAH1]
MTPNDASRAGGAPGSVAEEAALLVDLLSQRGWGAPSRMPSGTSDANGHSADRAHEQPHHDHPAADPSDRPDGSDDRHSARSDCTCGGTTPAACRVCPVCQLIAFVQQVNPDTIDRVADFVGFAATALRDLATAQRERREERGDHGDDEHNDDERNDDERHTTRPGGP